MLDPFPFTTRQNEAHLVNKVLLPTISLGGLSRLAFAAPIASEVQAVEPGIGGGSQSFPASTVDTFDPEVEVEDGLEIENRVVSPEHVTGSGTFPRSSSTSVTSPGPGTRLRPGLFIPGGSVISPGPSMGGHGRKPARIYVGDVRRQTTKPNKDGGRVYKPAK
ncbi:hypothetical protein PG999_012715 [Apiospora kogelbergensis]|uniref:Uncharacterized protein n=1 Tax=Apiospora kogelbergensis TaxID=1337665 RepID=A0AAW0QBR2_9PEZI